MKRPKPPLSMPSGSKSLLRLRAAFSRGNSESSFSVSSQHPCQQEKQQSRKRRKSVSWRVDFAEYIDNIEEPRNEEESKQCYWSRDDYAWFLRDAALCVEAYRQALKHNQPWLDGDQDNVSSVRGLEDLLRTPSHAKAPTTRAELRRRQVRAVLEAQEKMKLERHWANNSPTGEEDDVDSAICEHLRKVSLSVSKDCVTQALKLARDEPYYSFLSRLRIGAYMKQRSSSMGLQQQQQQD